MTTARTIALCAGALCLLVPGESSAQLLSSARATSVYFRAGPSLLGFNPESVNFRFEGRRGMETARDFSGKQLELGHPWVVGASLGVNVDAIDKPFDAPLERVTTLAALPAPAVGAAKGAYLIGPESYGTFKLVADLQKANVPVFRAGSAFSAGASGQSFAPGTFVIPATPAAQGLVDTAAKSLGLVVTATDKAPAVDGSSRSAWWGSPERSA